MSSLEGPFSMHKSTCSVLEVKSNGVRSRLQIGHCIVMIKFDKDSNKSCRYKKNKTITNFFSKPELIAQRASCTFYWISLTIVDFNIVRTLHPDIYTMRGRILEGN